MLYTFSSSCSGGRSLRPTIISCPHAELKFNTQTDMHRSLPSCCHVGNLLYPYAELQTFFCLSWSGSFFFFPFLKKLTSGMFYRSSVLSKWQTGKIHCFLSFHQMSTRQGSYLNAVVIWFLPLLAKCHSFPKCWNLEESHCGWWGPFCHGHHPCREALWCRWEKGCFRLFVVMTHWLLAALSLWPVYFSKYF